MQAIYRYSCFGKAGSMLSYNIKGCRLTNLMQRSPVIQRHYQQYMSYSDQKNLVSDFDIADVERLRMPVVRSQCSYTLSSAKHFILTTRTSCVPIELVFASPTANSIYCDAPPVMRDSTLRIG